MLQPGKSAALSPRTTLIALSVFVLVIIGVIVFIMKLNGSSGSAIALAPTKTVAQPSPKAMDTIGDVTADLTPAGDNYSVVVSRNIFQVQAGSAVATPPKPAPNSPPISISPVFPSTPTVQVPSVVFTGVVEIAGVKYALLENLLDHHAQYTRVGSEAFGYTLTTIDGRSATLTMDGSTTILNMGDNKAAEKTTPPVTATPLNPNITGGATGTINPNMPGGVTPGTTGQPGSGNFPGGFRNRRRQPDGQLPGEG